MEKNLNQIWRISYLEVASMVMALREIIQEQK